MTAKFKYYTKPGAFEAMFLGSSQRIVEAAHDTIEEAGAIVKTEARRDIAASGLGQGFVQALRVDVYPKQGSKKSINAAAHIYHKIPYAGVFEDGATIRGKPQLWVTLKSSPKKIGQKRMSPELFIDRIGPLQYVRMTGKKPMLFAKMKAGRGPTKGNITLARLRAAQVPGAKGPFMSVPIFIGVSTVNVRKRLNIKGIVRNATNKLAEIYASKIGAKLNG